MPTNRTQLTQEACSGILTQLHGPREQYQVMFYQASFFSSSILYFKIPEVTSNFEKSIVLLINPRISYLLAGSVLILLRSAAFSTVLRSSFARRRRRAKKT